MESQHQDERRNDERRGDLRRAGKGRRVDDRGLTDELQGGGVIVKDRGLGADEFREGGLAPSRRAGGRQPASLDGERRRMQHQSAALNQDYTHQPADEPRQAGVGMRLDLDGGVAVWTLGDEIKAVNTKPSGLAAHLAEQLILSPAEVRIATDVDPLPQAAYFRQVENGVFMRMAILKYLLKNYYEQNPV